MSREVHFILLAAGLLIIITSYLIRRINRSIFSEPVLVMLVGIVLNLMELENFKVNEPLILMGVFTRITIIVALVATVLRIKYSFIVSQKRNLTLMVVIAMAGMWLSSSLIFFLLIEQDLLLSLLVGAIITPTDPVVASSMVSGKLAKKLLPERIRSALSFEAGSNDGLAFPFVMFSFLLLIYPAGFALEEFFLKVLLWENITAIILAGGLGFVLGKAYHNFNKKKWMDKQAIIGFALAMTFMVYALFEVLKTNSIIGVFAAGLSFNAVISKAEAIKEESVQEVIERLLVVPIFFLFGLIAPWQDWLQMGWNLLWFALFVMLFRRLPVFFLLKYFLKGYNVKDIMVMGWFGPIGIAALFYALLINEKHHMENLWAITSFVVFVSTVIHGFTRYIVSKKYFLSTNKKETDI